MSRLTIEETILMIKNKISELDISGQEKISRINLFFYEQFKKNPNEFVLALKLFQCENII